MSGCVRIEIFEGECTHFLVHSLAVASYFALSVLYSLRGDDHERAFSFEQQEELRTLQYRELEDHRDLGL
jgi:hypothetical protein